MKAAAGDEVGLKAERGPSGVKPEYRAVDVAPDEIEAVAEAIADQLRQFGAQIFTVNMVGISILREMGILLTAIVVAGRSGSASAEARCSTSAANSSVCGALHDGATPACTHSHPCTIDASGRRRTQSSRADRSEACSTSSSVSLAGSRKRLSEPLA